MLKRLAAILVSVLAVGSAIADDYSECFVPGEVVEYRVYWMGIPIAWSRTTTEMVVEDGRELFHITLVAETFGAYRHIYEVNDKTEVWIDPKTALPVRHDWIIDEGSVHKSQLTTFYHDRKIAIFQDRISKDIWEVPIESNTREIFSFIYASRDTGLEELAASKHRLLVTGKMYDLEIKIRHEDDIKVDELGKVPSVEIEPVADFDGIFLRKGKVFFWVSKEKRRVVTCIKAKVAVGSITAKLQSVTGEGNTFWNRKN